MGYVPSDSDPPPAGLMRRVFALCNALGLERDERIELAEMLLGRDIDSYKRLVHYDAVRLVDAMVGFGLVSALKDLRDPCRICGERESATGKNGECRACRDAWAAWTAPPEVAEVIADALLASGSFLEELTDAGRKEQAAIVAQQIAEALHAANYRIDHH